MTHCACVRMTHDLQHKAAWREQVRSRHSSSLCPRHSNNTWDLSPRVSIADEERWASPSATPVASATARLPHLCGCTPSATAQPPCPPFPPAACQDHAPALSGLARVGEEPTLSQARLRPESGTGAWFPPGRGSWEVALRAVPSAPEQEPNSGLTCCNRSSDEAAQESECVFDRASEVAYLCAALSEEAASAIHRPRKAAPAHPRHQGQAGHGLRGQPRRAQAERV